MYFHRRSQFIDGKCWRMDGSHKVAKLVVVRRQGGHDSLHNEQVCDGILTWFNEYEQVLLQVSVLSHAMEEAATRIKEMLQKRYIQQGFPLPEVVFTDCCCSDRNFIQSIFKELNLSVRPSRVGACTPLELPIDVRHTVINYLCDDAALLAAKTIYEEMELQRMQVNDTLVVGVDMQWNLPKQNVPVDIATIQLSLLSGLSFLFRVKIEDDEKPWVPIALQRLFKTPQFSRLD
jgi:hypothetical protein